MDYYKDLTYYNRYHYENAKNIGFEKMTAEKKGNRLPAEFMPRLLKHLKYPLNSARGGDFRPVFVDGEKYTVGFSELRILDGKGGVYAAPDEVVAYIQDDVYAPPQEFVDAVLYGVDPDSEEYQAYLKRYRAPFCWGASPAYVGDVVDMIRLIESGDLQGVKDALARRKELAELVTGAGSLLSEAIIRKQSAIAMYLMDVVRLDKFEGAELLTAVESGMVTVVAGLMARKMPIKMDRPRNNPLFLAIGKNQNKVAEFLYTNYKQLVVTYNTEYTENCNILQWTKMCRNEEFMEFMLKTY